MVAVIIPAFNEGARIRAVLEAVRGSSLPDEIIVVNDASTDNTSAVAKSIEGVRVIELPRNAGKGGAMAAGVEATQADVLLFIDADLQGVRPEHIDAILKPVLNRRCEMCIGVFRGGKFWSTSAHRVAPYISGQRAMRRSLFLSIPHIGELRMGIEVALNAAAKRSNSRVARVVLRGVSNTHKERKMGIVRGAAARAKMWAEIGRAVVRVRRKKKRAVASDVICSQRSWSVFRSGALRTRSRPRR